MKTILSIILLLLIAHHSAFSDEVKMAFGDKIPPYCFPETNSGIELEVIGEALAFKGHVLKPKYVPFARIVAEFKKGNVDAAMTDLGGKFDKDSLYYGDPAVIYDNVFISLRDREFKINKPADLKGLSVFSFQGASKRYPLWLGPVESEGKYYEHYDQYLQLVGLFKKRYDLLLMDRNIFKYYYLRVAMEKNIILSPVQEHSFEKVNLMDYRPIFRHKKIRDDFNLGLKNLKKTGRYQAIFDKYLKESAMSKI